MLFWQRLDLDGKITKPKLSRHFTQIWTVLALRWTRKGSSRDRWRLSRNQTHTKKKTHSKSLFKNIPSFLPYKLWRKFWRSVKKCAENKQKEKALFCRRLETRISQNSLRALPRLVGVRQLMNIVKTVSFFFYWKGIVRPHRCKHMEETLVRYSWTSPRNVVLCGNPKLNAQTATWSFTRREVSGCGLAVAWTSGRAGSFLSMVD